MQSYQPTLARIREPVNHERKGPRNGTHGIREPLVITKDGDIRRTSGGRPGVGQ